MFGVFETFYVSTLLPYESESNIAWIGSLQGFLLFIFGLISGPLYDAGYLRALVYVGLFCINLGMFMTSLCTAYWQLLLAQGIVMGVGNGLLFVTSISLIPQYFTTKKSFATGVASLGSSIGGIIYPIIFRQLQPTIGFGWATRVIAFIMLTLSVVPLFAMHDRTRHASKEPISFQLFHGLPHLLFCVGMLFGFMGIYIVFFYVQLYALLECGMTPELASYLLAIVNSASIFGRLIPGYLADKIGPLNIFIPFALVTAVLTFCWIAIRTVAGLLVFCVLYGFFSGTFVSLPGPMGASLSPNVKTIGRRLGISMAFSGTGLLIGNPIAGVITQNGHDWLGLQIWAGALIILSAGFITASRILKVGTQLKKVI
ncbi:hypothetical protein MMC11_005071 [Xylographa trunciseda]|nr:hypothetical protein [Xylographa trunciseda]